MPRPQIEDVMPLMSQGERRVYDFLKHAAASGHREAAAAFGEHVADMIERYELEVQAAELCGVRVEELAR